MFLQILCFNTQVCVDVVAVLVVLATAVCATEVNDENNNIQNI